MPRPPWSTERVAYFVEAWGAGVPAEELCQRFGIRSLGALVVRASKLRRGGQALVRRWSGGPKARRADDGRHDTSATAARRLSMTVAEYQQRRASEKHCVFCRAWHPRSVFGRDRGRSDGLSHSCLASRRRESAAQYQRRRAAVRR